MTVDKRAGKPNRSAAKKRAYQIWQEKPDIKPMHIYRKLIAEGFELCERSPYTWRKKWIAGRLPGKNGPVKRVDRAIEQVKTKRALPNFEIVKETIVTAFEMAARVPALEEENIRLKNQLAAKRNEVEVVKRKYQGDLDQTRRFRLAIEQGEIGKKVDNPNDLILTTLINPRSPVS